jgi:transcriptional regulator with XRE-family HTH domain
MVNHKSLRTAKGLSQERLAEMAGVCRSTIKKLDAGKMVNVTSAKKVAEAIGCDWRLFFEGNAYNCNQGGSNDDPAA